MVDAEERARRDPLTKDACAECVEYMVGEGLERTTSEMWKRREEDKARAGPQRDIPHKSIDRAQWTAPHRSIYR